jgi:hypothetical protein
MSLPLMVEIKQNFPRRGLPDVPAAVREQLQRSNLTEIIVPGQKVGITAGSRGITNIVPVLAEIVLFVKSLGANPVILAAMGSHGGGTAGGQRAILADLGITPENVGAPVHTGADCRQVGKLVNGTPVFVTEIARACDAIIVVNRVKPHTSFHGPAESGLQKIITVGLGGPEGARALHRTGAAMLPEVIPAAARLLIGKLPIVLGLAILEDAYEDTMQVTAIPPEQLAQVEEELLNKARSAMPRLPVDRLDLLIVEQMGKNFSGTGMDTNIIGRMHIHGVPEPAKPFIQRITVLDLSPESHGNANGIGLADFTTRRLVNKIDFQATMLNVLTSTFVKRAMIPLTLPDDRTAIVTALRSLGSVKPTEARVLHIKNTLHLTSMRASAGLLPELRENPAIEIAGVPTVMHFDEYGNLLDTYRKK